MSRLLPPLETLAQMHSEVVIQELASNLRAVIATHGAYWPESLNTAAQASRNPAFKKTQKMQSKANNSQTGLHSSSLDSNLPPSTQITRPLSSGGLIAELGPKGGKRTSGINGPCPHTKALSDWLLEACDPDVPTRAVALRGLTQMVQNRNQEAVQAQEKILMVGCFLTVCASALLLLVMGLVSYNMMP